MTGSAEQTVQAPSPSAEPRPRRSAARHGWSLVDEARKREILDAICGTSPGEPPGPVHAELDLTDRCNVACYFCNQMDVRTKDALPFDHVVGLLDELVAGGLRSVRLSGGGDPLMYPEIVRVLDLFAERGVVVDNLTTNGARMFPEICERLVRNGAREAVISLNAVDAPEYARMMRVAPKVFGQVLENVRHLVALRGDAPSPALTVQFLIDRRSYRRLPEMVRLGHSLGADRIAINPVLEIPKGRLDEAPLLSVGDRQVVRPYLRQALEADVEDLLHLSFPWEPWNEMVDELRQEHELRPELDGEVKRPEPPAPSFRGDLDHCFFGWYTVAIRGTGEMYPCCMLMNPDYEPLGDLRKGSFTEQWRGRGFAKLRAEMREVFLTNGRVESEGMEALRPQCVKEGLCGLKTMFFRHDEAFYRELGEAVDEARRREIGWRGGWRGLRRAAGVFAYRVRWGVKTRWSQLLGRWFRHRCRRLPALAAGARVHVGLRPRTPVGALDGWALVGPHGATWADRTLGVGEPIPFRRAEAIHVDRVLEALLPEHARDFLGRVRSALAEDGVLRLVATHPAVEPGNGDDMARWSPDELEAELRAAGFAHVERLEYGWSRRPWLRNLEDHAVAGDTPELPATIVLEATLRRPADGSTAGAG